MTQRIPNTKCETVTSSAVQPGDVVRVKSFAPRTADGVALAHGVGHDHKVDAVRFHYRDTGGRNRRVYVLKIGGVEYLADPSTRLLRVPAPEWAPEATDTGVSHDVPLRADVLAPAPAPVTVPPVSVDTGDYVPAPAVEELAAASAELAGEGPAPAGVVLTPQVLRAVADLIDAELDHAATPAEVARGLRRRADWNDTELAAVFAPDPEVTAGREAAEVDYAQGLDGRARILADAPEAWASWTPVFREAYRERWAVLADQPHGRQVKVAAMVYHLDWMPNTRGQILDGSASDLTWRTLALVAARTGEQARGWTDASPETRLAVRRALARQAAAPADPFDGFPST